MKDADGGLLSDAVARTDRHSAWNEVFALVLLFSGTLLFFALMLGLWRRRPWLVGVSAALIPLIREDTGVLLVGVGLWLWWRESKRWPLALGLILYGCGWVALVTNVLMLLGVMGMDSGEK